MPACCAGAWLHPASAVSKPLVIFGVGEEEEARETHLAGVKSLGKAAVEATADHVALGERRWLF